MLYGHLGFVDFFLFFFIYLFIFYFLFIFFFFLLLPLPCARGRTLFTLSARKTKTDTFENSVDPDETAHNEPSHQDLQCLPFCSWFTTVIVLATIDLLKYWDEKSIPETQGWMG